MDIHPAAVEVPVAGGSPPHWSRRAAWIAVAICVVLALAAVLARAFDPRVAQAPAVVTRVESCTRLRSGADPLYQCVVQAEFFANGAPRHAAGLKIWRGTSVRVGSTLSVKYDPRDPSRVGVAAPPAPWPGFVAGAGAAIAVGLVLTA